MRILDVAELLLLAALWGGSFLFMRIAAPVLGPVWLIEMRVLLAGLVLLPFLLRLGLWSEVRRKAMPLFVIGCINSAIPFLLLAFASVSLPSGFTSILNATAPLFGTGITLIWLKEKLTSGRIIGFGLGFAGVLILVGWKAVVATPTFFIAVVAGLAAALMYAIAAPYAKKQLAGVPPLVIATASQLSAAIVLLPAIPFALPHAVPDPTVLISVLMLALFSTALAYILYFRLIRNVGSTKALTVAYLVPLFAIFWGTVVLSEPVTSSMVLGCGLILLGTAIANDLFKHWLEKFQRRSDMEKPAKNTICLWYDGTAEDAARFYAETFPDSSVDAVHRAPGDFPSGKQGDVLTVEFTVMGIPCLGLNGGSAFKHNEAFSFQVATIDQAETDRYWNAIVSNSGQESACGWCKDKWGLSWQITPIALTKAITDPDPAAAKRAFSAMMQMKKIDIAAIEAAQRG